MDEIGLNCPNCGYNLTGLTSDVCPECGTTFDLELLRIDPELRRIGTPVYGKRGIELIPRTMQTLWLMLFRPRCFARRLRVDEPLGPAILVFLMAISHNVWFLIGCPFVRGWNWELVNAWKPTAVFVAVTVLLALAGAVVFAALSARGSSRACTFPRRFRLWCIVVMYTMIFIPFWPFFCAGIRGLGWRDYTTVWPFFHLYSRSEAYPATILIFWWTLIISVVLWYRNRPRWLAIVLMLVAFLFVRASVQVADSFILRLSR